MVWNRMFFGLIIVFTFLLSISWNAGGAESNLKFFDSDEIAKYYYDIELIRMLPNNVISVRTTIIVKDGGDKSKLKLFYAGECPSRMELSNLVGIRCGIQIDCLNGRYRVTGGRFEDTRNTTICEPKAEFVKWEDIPPQSPIEKLSKIICPK